MTCEGCGCAVFAELHSEYHFAGEKTRRFRICGEVCYWRVVMRRAREEAAHA